MRCNTHHFIYYCWRDQGHDGLHFDYDSYATASLGGRVWADGDSGESWEYDVQDWPADAVRNLLKDGSEYIKNHIKDELFGQIVLPVVQDLLRDR